MGASCFLILLAAGECRVQDCNSLWLVYYLLNGGDSGEIPWSIFIGIYETDVRKGVAAKCMSADRQLLFWYLFRV